MSRPRLLHILGSSKFGGDSVLVLELARGAREQGFDVDILATDPRVQKLVRAHDFGLIDLDVVRREIRPLWDARGLLRLERFLARSRYDIVHTHTSKPGLVGRLAATRTGVPGVIHTVHGFGFHEETGRVANRFYATCEAAAAKWCHRIVTVSEYHREWALRLGIGSPAQIVAIPNGVPESRTDVDLCGRDLRAELGLGDTFVVLSTGRLAEQKGLEYLVRAAALLPDDPPTTVLLAGDGPLAPELERLIAALDVPRRVRLLGFRADIGDLLAIADVVALPSLWEGLSISLLEAMAASKAIITTSIGSNREVTENGACAVLVKPRDPEGLAEAITALVHDPARCAELGLAARQRQLRRYTLDRMVEAYAEEYQRLAGSTAERARHRRDEWVIA